MQWVYFYSCTDQKNCFHEHDRNDSIFKYNAIIWIISVKSKNIVIYHQKSWLITYSIAQLGSPSILSKAKNLKTTNLQNHLLPSGQNNLISLFLVKPFQNSRQLLSVTITFINGFSLTE